VGACRDEEAYEKAKDAARQGDTAEIEVLKTKVLLLSQYLLSPPPTSHIPHPSISASFVPQEMNEQSMSPEERLFWRMERYAKPWPPDWLARMQACIILPAPSFTALLQIAALCP